MVQLMSVTALISIALFAPLRIETINNGTLRSKADWNGGRERRRREGAMLAFITPKSSYFPERLFSQVFWQQTTTDSHLCS